VVGLEQALDAITAVAVAADHGAALPAPGSVRELEAVLRGLVDAGRSGTKPADPPRLPADEQLMPVTDPVRRVRAVLA
jgi:hypothetical protein